MSSSTIVRQDTIGGLRAIYGTYDAAGGTSMTITTPLQKVYAFIVDAETVGQLMPNSVKTAGSVALTNLTSGQTGNWLAIGQ
jgi:hypothetical protein